MFRYDHRLGVIWYSSTSARKANSLGTSECDFSAGDFCVEGNSLACRDEKTHLTVAHKFTWPNPLSIVHITLSQYILYEVSKQMMWVLCV